MKKNTTTEFGKKLALRFTAIIFLLTGLAAYAVTHAVDINRPLPEWLETGFMWLIPNINLQFFGLMFVVAVAGELLVRKLKLKTRMGVSITYLVIEMFSLSMVSCGAFLIGWNYMARFVYFIQPIAMGTLLGLCFVLLGALYYFLLRGIAVFVWRKA